MKVCYKELRGKNGSLKVAVSLPFACLVVHKNGTDCFLLKLGGGCMFLNSLVACCNMVLVNLGLQCLRDVVLFLSFEMPCI